MKRGSLFKITCHLSFLENTHFWYQTLPLRPPTFETPKQVFLRLKTEKSHFWCVCPTTPHEIIEEVEYLTFSSWKRPFLMMEMAVLWGIYQSHRKHNSDDLFGDFGTSSEKGGSFGCSSAGSSSRRSSSSRGGCRKPLGRKRLRMLPPGGPPP